MTGLVSLEGVRDGIRVEILRIEEGTGRLDLVSVVGICIGGLGEGDRECGGGEDGDSGRLQ